MTVSCCQKSNSSLTHLQRKHKYFTFLASRLWNSLPPVIRESKDIRTFKRCLEAFMSKSAQIFIRTLMLSVNIIFSILVL